MKYRRHLQALESAVKEFRHDPNVTITRYSRLQDKIFYHSHRLAVLQRSRMPVRRSHNLDPRQVGSQIPRPPIHTPVTINDCGDFKTFRIIETPSLGRVVAERYNSNLRRHEWVKLIYHPLALRRDHTLFGLWLPSDLSCKEAQFRGVDVHMYYDIDTTEPRSFVLDAFPEVEAQEQMCSLLPY